MLESCIDKNIHIKSFVKAKVYQQHKYSEKKYYKEIPMKEH